MPITLVLHGEMRQHSGGRRTILVAAGPATVAELLRASDIPLGESAALIVNGEQREADAPVVDGDTVEVLPAISGGRE
ncbi:MAG: MoaD/ThiS family protein [Chloroflexota bacterium]|nr:MoaD/ThiS family protein [Chloroflexota bacterium]